MLFQKKMLGILVLLTGSLLNSCCGDWNLFGYDWGDTSDVPVVGLGTLLYRSLENQHRIETIGWEADGEHVNIFARQYDQECHHLCRLDVTTRNVEIPLRLQSYAWTIRPSTDYESLALFTSDAAGMESYLCVVDIPGYNLDAVDRVYTENIYTLVWSEDSSRLCYQVIDSLFVVDTGCQVRTHSLHYPGRVLAFSQDNTRLLIQKSDLDLLRIVSLDLESLNTALIVTLAYGQVRYVSWNPLDCVIIYIPEGRESVYKAYSVTNDSETILVQAQGSYDE